MEKLLKIAVSSKSGENDSETNSNHCETGCACHQNHPDES